MWWAILGGGILLTIGAEALVRGASRLAALAGVSPLVIGLTVVAFGTSAPELAVSLKAAWVGQGDIAIGNVVGSNIVNVLVILGLCALIQPLKVHTQLIKIDVPIMIGVSILTFALAWDGLIGRMNGALLAGGSIAYTVFTIQKSRNESARVKSEFADALEMPEARGIRTLVTSLFFVVLGLAALVIGSRLFVDGAVALARLYGVSELVIGLTIVAFGTSLPEVATSVMASIRGERDIAIGNVVGSSLFNLLVVLGFSSLVSPIPVATQALYLDLPVMIGVAIACVPIFFTGFEIRRWEGLLFLLLYAAYTAYLIMNATQYHALATYNKVMLMLVLPLVAVTLLVLATQDWRRGRRSGNGAAAG
jgi:cation:H+ antiporter